MPKHIDVQLFPQALIFDWDNTLVNSWPVIAECLNKVRAHYGLETWTVEECRVKSARALRVSFPEWFGDEWENARDMFYDHYNAIHATHIRPMDGAQDLLRAARDKGLKMMVVSNKKGNLLRAEVKALGWDDYFLSVKGSMDAPKDKPAPDAVYLALAEAEVDQDAAPVWFVGDSYADVECGLRSGTVPVLVYNQKEAERFGLKLSFSDCHTMVYWFYNGSKPHQAETESTLG